MNKKTKTIAITGIDGSGKSTVTSKLIDIYGTSGNKDVMVMNCTSYHKTPNVPLADLSRELEAFTQIADNLKSFELKAISLFLQITLFGTVERFLMETYQPDILINERHAVIDGLCYSSFYKMIFQKAPDRSRFEEPVKKMLESAYPGAYASINKWVDIFAKRVGKTFTLWDIHTHILDSFALEGEAVVQNLETQFQTRLPDVLLLLDVKGEQANARIKGREDNHKELHEQSGILEQLRQEYFRIIDMLNEKYPDVETHVVDTTDSESMDAVLNKVI